MSPITGLSTHRSTLKIGTGLSTHRSTLKIGTLHTQAAALKLDLNDINMCLSMSPITGLSTHRSTLKIGTEHSGSQHSSTQRLSRHGSGV
jgi:hypothetical protein